MNQTLSWELIAIRILNVRGTAPDQGLAEFAATQRLRQRLQPAAVAAHRTHMLTSSPSYEAQPSVSLVQEKQVGGQRLERA